MKVLFSSAGRRVELANCFRQDARELGLELKVLASDANPKMSAACHLADRSFAVPPCSDSKFLPALLEICEREEVQLLIPTIDTELEMIARSRQEFAKLGTLVAISGLETVAICRDKLRTAEILSRAGITVPRTLALEELKNSPGILKFPIVLKPKSGSSSHGIIRIKGEAELSGVTLNLTSYIAQELLQGREYTVNLFFDDEHRLRCSIAHWRIETRQGEVSKGITDRNEVLSKIAGQLGRALPDPFGTLCFQAIVSEMGEISIFEINARFGGGFPLAHRAGAKFSKWLLEWAAGLPSTISDQWQAGLTMLRFDKSVFF